MLILSSIKQKAFIVKRKIAGGDFKLHRSSQQRGMTRNAAQIELVCPAKASGKPGISVRVFNVPPLGCLPTAKIVLLP